MAFAVDAIPADKFLEAYLEDSGNSIDMQVDGSVTAVPFEFTTPADCLIARCNIYILDANPTPTVFGGLGGELTNGLLIQVLDDTPAVIKTFVTQRPTANNADIVALAGIDVSYDLGAGTDSVAARWTFARHSGGYDLFMPAGQTFRVTIRDDLTGLTQFHWVLEGRFL